MSTALALIMAASAQDTTTRTLPANMPAMAIRGGAADITIRYTPGAASSQVTITPIQWWEGCELAFSGSRSMAVMELQENGEPAGRACRAEIELTLAGTTDVEVLLERGDLYVEDTRGSLDATIGIGSVTGTPAGDTTVTLRRGKVELWDLSAPVQADVTIGRIDLTYATAITGTVAANVNIGRIETRFPYGTWINATVDSGLGRAVRTIPSRSASMTRLDASSRVGNIRVEAIMDEQEEIALSDAD